MKIKSLIIIAFLSVCSIVNGQTKYDLLNKIDFNDTTLIGTERLTSQIMDYIGDCQDTTKSARKQIYDVIYAVDDVLDRCCSYSMYKFVYQYLIYGFSELGTNEIVDYMMRLPHIENLELNDNEYDEILAIAELYSRVKIGAKAPDIQAVTIDKKKFCLEDVKTDYVIVLFWSARCEHCRDLIKELGTYIADKHDVTLVSVCVMGNKRIAKKYMRKAKINAVNIYDGFEWNSPIVNAYAVDATPSMFLLDEEKNIIAKPFSIEDIERNIK